MADKEQAQTQVEPQTQAAQPAAQPAQQPQGTTTQTKKEENKQNNNDNKKQQQGEKKQQPQGEKKQQPQGEKKQGAKKEGDAASPNTAPNTADVGDAATTSYPTKQKKPNVKNLKVPKGTRDYEPLQMSIREEVFSMITKCFKRHGAVTIETPVFELKETLEGKFGEDSKLIYDLQDQGGELCSLRYDLTVPFARYLAMAKLKQMKRYHIGRVYRRDNPAITKGRFREFYQCDYDIAGTYDMMLPDSECLRLLVEILNTVDVGKFIIKLNHRKLLDGMFAICGVPEDKFRPICSAVDKLDKTPWEEVKKEMIEVKGLPEVVADRIHQFVVLHGKPRELLKKLRDEKRCDGNEVATQALADLDLLFSYLELFGVDDKVEFDLSLARGLDYYTGIIFEAVLLDGPEKLGSIAAGGRYDGLVGIFGGSDIPAVGFSVGIERIFTILEEREKQAKKFRPSATMIFIASVGDNLLNERLKLADILWKANIPTEYLYKVNPKIQPQLNYANQQGIPFALIFGADDLAKNIVQFKDLTTTKQEPISRDELIPFLQQKFNIKPESTSSSSAAAPASSSSSSSSSQAPETK